MSRNKWNTYALVGFTTQHGDNRAACGGVTLWQIKRGRSTWLRRAVDSNGRHEGIGRAEPVDEAEGEALFETALAR